MSTVETVDPLNNLNSFNANTESLSNSNELKKYFEESPLVNTFDEAKKIAGVSENIKDAFDEIEDVVQASMNSKGECRHDALVAALALKVDASFLEKIKKNSDILERLHRHQYLASQIKNELHKLTAQDLKDDEQINLSQDLNDNIDEYRRMFDGDLFVGFDDPLKNFYNNQHPSFQTPGNLDQTNSEETNIINITKGDLTGAIQELDNFRGSVIINKIQATMMESEAGQKNYEIITTLLVMMMGMASRQFDTMIHSQRQN